MDRAELVLLLAVWTVVGLGIVVPMLRERRLWSSTIRADPLGGVLAILLAALGVVSLPLLLLTIVNGAPGH